MGIARRFAAVVVVGAISTIGLTAAFAAPAGADTTGFTVIGNVLAPTTCQLARIDLNTGVLAPFGPTDASHCVFDLTIAPDGTLYGVLVGPTAHLFRFDTTTGAATDLGQVGAFVLNGPGKMQGNLTFDAAGNLLVYLVPQTAQGSCPAITNFCLFRVNPANPGSATPLGPVPQIFTIYYGLATSPSGTLSSVRLSLGPASVGSTASTTTTTTTTTVPGVHASAGSWPPVHATIGPAQTLTVVNGSNGSTTDVGTNTGTPFTVSLDYDSAGALWAVGFPSGPPALSSNVITIDPGTGIATLGPAITSGGAPAAVMALAIPRPAAPVVVQPRFTG